MTKSKFQSTLPHGSDNNGKKGGKIMNISIHAPSRERLCPGVRSVDGQRISIHAPSRERLKYQPWFNHSSTDFNPRSLTGATLRYHCKMRLIDAFQSTLPHGSDFCALVGFLLMSDFNPRSLTGATASKQNTSTFI